MPHAGLAKCFNVCAIRFSRWRKLLNNWYSRLFATTSGRFTTGLRCELFRVNQTYNLLMTVAYVSKHVVRFYNMFYNVATIVAEINKNGLL